MWLKAFQRIHFCQKQFREHFLEMLGCAFGDLSGEVSNRMIDRDDERDQPGYL
jgi:hypothetical protein